MAWISNHKQKIEEKLTKRSRFTSKVFGIGLADLWEFQTLGIKRILFSMRKNSNHQRRLNSKK